MLKEISGPYYIVCGYTDLRRGIDGLAGIVQQNFKLDVCSGAVFLFCGRRYDRIKALLWEGDQITPEQYTWLMQGLSIEQPKAIRQSKRKPDIM